MVPPGSLDWRQPADDVHLISEFWLAGHGDEQLAGPGNEDGPDVRTGSDASAASPFRSRADPPLHMPLGRGSNPAWIRDWRMSFPCDAEAHFPATPVRGHDAEGVVLPE